LIGESSCVRRAPTALTAPPQAGLSTASFDVQMLTTTRGRERTLGEWQRLFEKNGWKLQEVVGLQSFGKILVAREVGRVDH